MVQATTGRARDRGSERQGGGTRRSEGEREREREINKWKKEGRKELESLTPNHFFTAKHKISRSEFPVAVVSIYVISKDTRKTRFPPSINSYIVQTYSLIPRIKY